MSNARHIWNFVPLVIALCVIAGPQYGASQTVLVGKCSEPPVQEDFDPEKYAGKWYEVERTFALFQVDMKCVTATYLPNADGNFKVINEAIRRATNRSVAIEGIATPRADNPAKLTVTLQGVPFPAPYWVLFTNYRYALVWSCTNLGLVHTEYIWLLSRTNYLPQDIKLAMYAKLDELKISRAQLTPTDHTNCPAEY